MVSSVVLFGRKEEGGMRKEGRGRRDEEAKGSKRKQKKKPNTLMFQLLRALHVRKTGQTMFLNEFTPPRILNCSP